MGTIQLENIANVPEDYKSMPRTSVYTGLIISPELILKTYQMLKADEHFNPSLVANACRFLEREIERKKVDPMSGMGFAILSTDMLNVARWGAGGNARVLFNQLYQFSPNMKDPLDWSDRLSIEKSGSFCIWELGIVANEKEAWKRYLASKRTAEDKKAYLDSRMEGDL